MFHFSNNLLILLTSFFVGGALLFLKDLKFL